MEVKRKPLAARMASWFVALGMLFGVGMAHAGTPTIERPGDTFETLSARYDSRVSNDPDALLEMIRAARVCKDYEPAWRSEQWIMAYFMAFGAWQDQFCGRNRSAEFTRYEAMKATVAWKEIPGAEFTIDMANDIALTSQSPYRLQMAAYTIAGSNAWRLGMQFDGFRSSSVRFGELQAAAVQLVACEFSGACEAGGTETMWTCARDRTCKAGETLFDQWQKKYSPADIGTLLLIRNELLKQRARRQSVTVRTFLSRSRMLA